MRTCFAAERDKSKVSLSCAPGSDPTTHAASTRCDNCIYNKPMHARAQACWTLGTAVPVHLIVIMNIPCVLCRASRAAGGNKWSQANTWAYNYSCNHLQQRLSFGSTQPCPPADLETGSNSRAWDSLRLTHTRVKVHMHLNCV